MTDLALTGLNATDFLDNQGPLVILDHCREYRVISRGETTCQTVTLRCTRKPIKAEQVFWEGHVCGKPGTRVAAPASPPPAPRRPCMGTLTRPNTLYYDDLIKRFYLFDTTDEASHMFSPTYETSQISKVAWVCLVTISLLCPRVPFPG